MVACVLHVEDGSKLTDSVREVLEPHGFEVQAFLVGWYNDLVGCQFKLSYPADTLAFVVVSTPRMFKTGFKNFLCRRFDLDSLKDPVDDCMVYYFNQVKMSFPDRRVDTIHDFELSMPSRRPKVLVQTAGHVSGAAYYYQRSDIKSDPWEPTKKMFGVCVHPKYGGWFGLRGVLIFSDITVPHLPRVHPEELLATDDKKIELLERLNFHWEDWTFRDIIPVEEKYCEEQKLYFGAKPSERKPIIEHLRSKWLNESIETIDSVQIGSSLEIMRRHLESCDVGL